MGSVIIEGNHDKIEVSKGERIKKVTINQEHINISGEGKVDSIEAIANIIMIAVLVVV